MRGVGSYLILRGGCWQDQDYTFGDAVFMAILILSVLTIMGSYYLTDFLNRKK